MKSLLLLLILLLLSACSPAGMPDCIKADSNKQSSCGIFARL